MNTKKKTLINYLRWLVRKVEPIDSPGERDKWCLLWRVNNRIGIGDALPLDMEGLIEVRVDKAEGNGIIDLIIGSSCSPTFRFVNKALCKEIIDRVKPMYGIVDTPKRKVA